MRDFMIEPVFTMVFILFNHGFYGLNGCFDEIINHESHEFHEFVQSVNPEGLNGVKSVVY